MIRNTISSESGDFPVSLYVNKEVIRDMLINAIETGIHYWCTRVTTDLEDFSMPGSNLYNIEHDEWSLNVTTDDGETIVINKEDIKSGISYMAEHCSRHFLDMITRNDDAITADVFFQSCVFKEIIYG
jgi:hypothetical protein